MALVKKAALEQLNKVALTTYNSFFTATESAVSQLVTRQPINGPAYVHSFITSVGALREWTGERVAKSVAVGEFTGRTKKWERTVEVDVEDVLTDLLTPFTQKMSAVGAAAATHLDERVAALLQDGIDATKRKTYDGLAIFSASHARDDGTVQSNNNTSQALTSENLAESWEQMLALTDPEGKPLKMRPRYLVVPSQLVLTARDLVSSQLVNSGSSNVLNTLGLEIVHLPELDSQATTWYLLGGRPGMTPFMNYEFQAPQLASQTNATDDAVFYADKFVFGVTARNEVEAAPWECLQRNIA